ncbi:hypothetical protein [Flavobacterium filum]|uniref:hypothetical protein n=1 Tax=Flavobacterium filum TaxID=370974 RepID=UPI0023F27A75|nr:hypothetical protein [Flavobacterium filum]
MKKLCALILFGLISSTNIQGQDTKTIVVTYSKTQWLVGDDGEKVSVKFKKDDGSEVPFNEDASSFVSPGKEKEQKEILFFDEAVKGSDRTRKENVGKKFIIEYYDFYEKIVSVKPYSVEQTSKQPMPTGSPEFDFNAVKKKQEGFLAMFKCPNCPETSAKQFLKEELGRCDKELKTETSSRKKQRLEGQKALVNEILLEKKFTTYIFSKTRASVIVYLQNKNRYIGIQLRNTNNKWIGIGLDDNYFNCKDMEAGDAVSQEEQMTGTLYLDKILKGK